MDAETTCWPRSVLVMEATLRASDFVGRYGGEEFVILLPDTGREEGAAVAEKIRAAVEATVVPDVALPITASLGLAVLPDDAGDSAMLLRHADRLLYAAKANGRNRVVAHAAANPQSPAQDERTTSLRRAPQNRLKPGCAEVDGLYRWNSFSPIAGDVTASSPSSVAS